MKHNRLMRLLCAGMMLVSSVYLPKAAGMQSVNAAYDDIFTYGDFEYKNMYGNIYITAYTGTNKNVDIPNTIDGKKVIYFYPGVFSGNEEIESITIHANIQNIEGGSFYGCTSLKKIVSYNKNYVFSNGFFYRIYPDENVHQTTTISNTMVKTEQGGKTTKTYRAEYDLHKAVLFYTKDSQYVTVPEGVDDIAPYAFAGRSKMTHIVLPAGIKRIGEKAFMGCSELRGMSMTANEGEVSEFNIPYGTVVIESSAFIGCTSIRNVNFPSTLEAIGKYAFASGMNLKAVYIPESVQLIGDYAFGATAAENGNCMVHCECVILVSDEEMNEDGELSAAAEYAYSCRENFSETASYNGAERDENGDYTVTVKNTFGTESYIVSEPTVTHNPDNDFDHTYIYTA